MNHGQYGSAEGFINGKLLMTEDEGRILYIRIYIYSTAHI